MPELDLATLVWGVRRMTRNSQLFGHRVLLLSDSMSAILALSKCRSSSALLTGCRVWVAHVLGFALMPSLRWIPSVSLLQQMKRLVCTCHSLAVMSWESRHAELCLARMRQFTRQW